jgi:hypothetical protein
MLPGPWSPWGTRIVAAIVVLIIALALLHVIPT